uniref:Poly A polymerase head domain-containing protein n=1 Tax=Emiliania huxleyi TaxID=2903 RepID=A0A7S3TAI6_EMIHU
MRAASGSSSARALADGAVAHGELLPAELVARVPHREKLVLSFVLAFLEANALPAQLLVNGGYVRDLLLGSVPDDLDLSLCLRECDPAVTVATVMHGLPGFALERPELNVSSVTITTILSDASKDKNVDTAKAHLVVGSPPERIEVDFMPTIGEETYDEFNRVPERDVRGTPEQDALRRDLTIGAMLLHVFQPRGSGPSGGGGAAAPEAAAEALQWRLLDFYGGLADLQRRVLRSPYPAGADASLVRASVLRYAEERELARKMGLLPSDGAAGSPARSDSPAPAGAAGEGAEALQVVWWIKVLRDDPLRVLRALRFSAKLGFQLHSSFWLAVPFALSSLQSKVAGSRKKDELVKIARAGREPLLTFLDLSFGFPLPNATCGGGGLPCLAPALFGGADPKGVAQFLSPAIVTPPEGANLSPSSASPSSASPPPFLHHSELPPSCELLLPSPVDPAGLPPLGAPPPFSSAAMRAAAAKLPQAVPEEEALGAALAAAIYSCRLAPPAPPPPPGARSAADALAAGAADAAMCEVMAACDGLSASNEMRQSAHTPLWCVKALLDTPPQLGMFELLATAASRGDGGQRRVGGREFGELLHMWQSLKLASLFAPDGAWCGVGGAARRTPGYLPDFILELAGTRCERPTLLRLREQLQLLQRDGPPISGEALGALPSLPPHLRGTMIACLHVLCRIEGAIAPLSDKASLRSFLEEHALLDALDAEWYVDAGEGKEKGCKGRELRPQYEQAVNRPKPKKKGKKAE